METDGQVNLGAGSIEMPKELEAAIQAKVAQIVAEILEDVKLGRRKRGRCSRSRSRSKSRSRSRSKNREGRSRSRSHGKNKHRHFGRDRSRSRSRSKNRGGRSRSRSHGKKMHRHFGRDRSRSRGRNIGWEGFAQFPLPHHHFHHHHPPHHAWFGGEFGPGARRGRWGKHGRFPFERNFECKCGSGAEEKNDEGKNKEGTPAAERNLRSDLEYLDLDDGVAEVN